ALGQLKIPHGAVGGGEAVGDLVLALLQGMGQRGPDELHAEPHEDGEARHLAEQRHVDIHAFNLTISVSVDQLSCDGQGSGTNAGATTKIRYMEIPTAMMGMASIRPASRNILPCSMGPSSG